MTKTPQQIGKTSRRKGQRIENEIVHLHQDNLIPAEKVSRGGYTGHDLMTVSYTHLTLPTILLV